LKDRRVSAKSISEQNGVSRERVGIIIHEDFHMRKLSAMWFPKCLKADQNLQQSHSSEKFWKFLTRSKIFAEEFGDHGRNMIISLWSGDRAAINGVAA